MIFAGKGLYQSSVSPAVPHPHYGYNLKSDSHRHLVQKPIYYGDTGPVGVYRDPVTSYHIKTANSPDSRFGSDFVKISAPLVSFKGEPIIQAVQNPYQVSIATTGLTEEPEPQPEPAPSVSSFSGEKVSSEGNFVSVGEDLDDPFEPEAEVDLEVDFLPSVNPLSQLSSSVPSQPHHQPHPLQTNFISQSLELLPQSFLEGVRLQRQFEDQVADLREDSSHEHDLDLQQSNNHKRENIQEIYPESKEAILTDASLNRDKILAYNVYKNQWTTSGDKKLVVDASKALQDYYRKYNLPAERQFSRDHNDFDIELSGPHQPERDNQVKKIKTIMMTSSRFMFRHASGHVFVFITATGGAAFKVFFFRRDTLWSTDAIYEFRHPGYEEPLRLSDLPQVRVGHDVLRERDPPQHEECPRRQQV